MARPSFYRLRSFFLLVSLASCVLATALPIAHAEDPQTLDDILSAAESSFKAMKDRDYRGIWETLSAASRETIVDETRKSISRAGGDEISKEDVRRDFDGGGAIAREYWTGFLTHFDPDLVLEESRWEKVAIDGDRAEIRIVYRTAEKPALLNLYREGGSWKVGLVETFWGRK